jgi:hypothetical protein
MAKDYRRAGRSKDDWIALETLDSAAEENSAFAMEIAGYAMEIDKKQEELDAIDSLTLLMKLGQYFADNNVKPIVRDDD